MASRGAPFLFFRRRNRRLRSAGVAKSGEHFQKSVQSSREAWRRRWVLLWRGLIALGACGLLISAVVGAHYFVYHSSRFALKKLRVSGTQRLSAALIEQRAEVQLHTNLLRIDPQQVETRLLREPWLKSATVRRELPATLHIAVSEHVPVALLALDALYLCDAEGTAFKRAVPSEGVHLPVVTGIGRSVYTLEPAYARTQIQTALSALFRYQNGRGRPTIGEVHIDRFVGVTLYTQDGLAIRLGKGEPQDLDIRLGRFDAVWQTLQKGGGDIAQEQRPVMVYLDNRAHPDQVTVRFAQSE